MDAGGPQPFVVGADHRVAVLDPAGQQGGDYGVRPMGATAGAGVPGGGALVRDPRRAVGIGDHGPSTSGGPAARDRDQPGDRHLLAANSHLGVEDDVVLRSMKRRGAVERACPDQRPVGPGELVRRLVEAQTRRPHGHLGRGARRRGSGAYRQRGDAQQQSYSRAADPGSLLHVLSPLDWYCSGAARTLKTRQAVIWNRLPWHGRADPLPVGGADSRILLQRSQTNKDMVGVVGHAVDLTAAIHAVPLRLPARWLPGAEQVGAAGDREGVLGKLAVRRRGSAGTPLAVVTVAVPRGQEWRADREPDAAAGTPSAQWLISRGRDEGDNTAAG